nr:unnamed protein product [Digitaria exilis]
MLLLLRLKPSMTCHGTAAGGGKNGGGAATLRRLGPPVRDSRRFLWGATEDTGEVRGEVIDVLFGGVDDANVTENLPWQQPVDVVELVMHVRAVAVVGHCELD